MGPNRNAENVITVYIDQGLEEIVPGFLENRRRDVQTIETALQENNMAQILTIGHRMHGDGGGYGLDAISIDGCRLGASGSTGRLERDPATYCRAHRLSCPGYRGVSEIREKVQAALTNLVSEKITGGSGGNNRERLRLVNRRFTRSAGWWRAGELNPRPLRCERSALPTELAPHWTVIQPVRRMPHRAAYYTQPFLESLAGC